MKKIAISILLFMSLTSIYAQKTDSSFATDAFGLSSELAFSRVNQISGDLHFNIFYNLGTHFWYTYSFYPKSNYSLGFSIAGGINFLKEIINIPADKYNLQWDFIDIRQRYIPNISLTFDYSRILFESSKNKYFAAISPGILSAIGYNQQASMGMADIDSLYIMNDIYKYVPNPIIDLELGMKRELRNGNFLNISLVGQISFAKKYTTDYQFFVKFPAYKSHSQIITNLSYIGIKFTYEIKEKE
jgi:hypothetical protein